MWRMTPRPRSSCPRPFQPSRTGAPTFAAIWAIYCALDGLRLRLAATEAAVCGLTVNGGLPRIPQPAFPTGTPAFVQHGTVAYLTRREQPAALDGTRLYELGAGAFGPFAERQATAFHDQVRAWGWSRLTHPSITVFPADTPDEQLPERGQRIRRPSQCLVMRVA